jgi:hypothetical protein
VVIAAIVSVAKVPAGPIAKAVDVTKMAVRPSVATELGAWSRTDDGAAEGLPA